jgi:hypothetical protein
MKNLILRKSVVWGFVFSLTVPVLYSHSEETAQPVEVKADAAKSDPVIADAVKPEAVKPEAVTPVAVKTEKANEQKYANSYGKKNRPLGDFLVGPYATVVALPRPFTFGLEAKWNDWLGLSAGYGFLPQISIISSVKTKLTGYDVRLKFYPFQGSFFLGLAYGSQTLTGNMTQTISGVVTTGTVVQDNQFIGPHLGWNWIWDCGFFMGMDLGVQLSMNRKTTFTDNSNNPTVQNSAEYLALKKDILDAAELVGKTPFPILSLVKIGYFF